MPWHSLFDIRFHGPAMQGGSMRITDLAPALLALNDLFEKAHELVNAYPSSLSLNIHEVHDGSHLSLALVENLDPMLVNLFTPNGEAVLHDLVDLIVGSEGLLSFIDTASGRPFDKDVTKPGPAFVRFENDEEVSVDRRIPQLYAHPRIRQYAYGVLQPLEREGITRFSTRGVDIDQSRLVHFDPPSPDRETPDSVVRELVLKPETVHFARQNRWRMTDGDLTFPVQILDEAFLDAVRQGRLALAATDLFRVAMRTIRWQNAWGTREQHLVDKVLEHRPQSAEPTLFEATG